MICPSCGRDLGNSLSSFGWCPGDRAFFCSACTRGGTKCPACKGRPSEVQLRSATLVLLVILTASSALILPQHISRTLDIQMPNTAIANVSSGQSVKLFGEISSPQQYAFTLMFRDGRWQLQMHTNLSIVDSKGRGIRLDLAGCHDFYPQSHNLSDKDHSDFWNGDNVTVFGTVVEDGQGNKTLDVTRIYPGATDPYAMTPGWYQTLWLIPAVCLVLLVQVLAIYGYRRRLHSRYLREHPPDAGGALDAGGDEKNVVWRQSPLPDTERKRSMILALISVVLGAGVLAASVLEPWAWVDSPIPLVCTSLLMVLAAVSAFFFWEMTHITPGALGVSDKGLHFRYGPTKRKPAQTVSLPWSGISDYTSNTWRSSSRLKFNTETRSEDVVLPKRLSRLIEDEFVKRKGPAEAARSSPAAIPPSGR